ncbi:MAG: hypothetical protein ACXVWT_09765 [Solirubrobacteraceae bacterium]
MAEPTRGRTHQSPSEPVNEARARIYARLMDAQEQIAVQLYRRGVSHQAVLDALDVVDEELSEDERREDLYLAALARYVAVLGGRVEVRAVFEGDEILVRQEPG